MSEQKRNYLEFCCMGHESYFTEEFLSDDEDSSFTMNFTSSFDVKFAPNVYDEIEKEMSFGYGNDEKSVQCDKENPCSLGYLSALPAFSVTISDKILIPNEGFYQMKHTPRITMPCVKEMMFFCSSCKAGFKSGQALGGHMSRKH